VLIQACQFTGGNTAIDAAACDVSIRDSLLGRNGMGMSVRCSQVVVAGDQISHNTRGGIVMYTCPDVVFDHCLIAGNGGSYGYQAIQLYNVLPVIRNCTVVGNASWRERGVAAPIRADALKAGQIVNCIFWDNRKGAEDVLSQCVVRFSNIQGGWPGEGNINTEPSFAADGYWDVDASRGGSSVWIDGDYHLKSQAGRWSPVSGSWVSDDVTSPCIDAGDPNMSVGDEPQPNGGRINMGVYGGTVQASKSDAGDNAK